MKKLSLIASTISLSTFLFMVYGVIGVLFDFTSMPDDDLFISCLPITLIGSLLSYPASKKALAIKITFASILSILALLAFAYSNAQGEELWRYLVIFAEIELIIISFYLTLIITLHRSLTRKIEARPPALRLEKTSNILIFVNSTYFVIGAGICLMYLIELVFGGPDIYLLSVFILVPVAYSRAEAGCAHHEEPAPLPRAARGAS